MMDSAANRRSFPTPLWTNNDEDRWNDQGSWDQVIDEQSAEPWSPIISSIDSSPTDHTEHSTTTLVHLPATRHAAHLHPKTANFNTPPPSSSGGSQKHLSGSCYSHTTGDEPVDNTSNGNVDHTLVELFSEPTLLPLDESLNRLPPSPPDNTKRRLWLHDVSHRDDLLSAGQWPHQWPASKHQRQISLDQSPTRDPRSSPLSLSETARPLGYGAWTRNGQFTPGTPMTPIGQSFESSSGDTTKHLTIASSRLQMAQKRTLPFETTTATPLESKRSRLSKSIVLADHKSKSKQEDMRKHIVVFHTCPDRPREKPDEGRQRKINQKRKDGVCFSCKWKRKTCEFHENAAPGTPCQNCPPSFAADSLRNYHPCFKVNLSEVCMFRIRSPVHKVPAGERIEYLPNAYVMLEVNLTGRLTSSPMRIRCQPFKPTGKDVVKKLWGASKPIEIRPYAVVDLEQFKTELQPKLRTFTAIFVRGLAAHGFSPTVVETLELAISYAEEHPDSLVDMGLDIWVGSKICGTEKALVGQETLGLDPVQEVGAPLYGLRPIPPKVDHQTDTAMIEILMERANRLIAALFKKLFARDKTAWFEIYLTFFIIVNNLEYVIGNQVLFRTQWCENRDAPRTNNLPEPERTEYRNRAQNCINASEKFIEEWMASVNRLLYVYHVYFRTKFPFTEEQAPQAIKDAGLDLNSSEVEYIYKIIRTRESIVEQGRNVADVTGHNYEMVWGSQLFKLPDSRSKAD